MNKIFSPFPRFSLYTNATSTLPLSSIGASSFLFLCIIALWMQSSSLCQAQDAAPNSPPLTVIDDSATNAPTDATTNLPPDSATNSLVAPIIEKLHAANPTTSPPGTSSSTNLETNPTDNSPPSVAKAAKLYAEGKPDEALATVNTVLDKESKNENAYILRGAINAQKQAWDLAEKDYETALQLDPKNDGVRYDLADLKFRQKQFDVARAAFVPLLNNQDSTVSDLIKYKIFLCDLFEGREDAANKELDAFNQVGSNASYYFSNAAWDLVHKKPEDARSWLISASHIYPARKQLLYATILKDMGYLPLPPAAG